MPKSRNRKAHKVKSAARTQSLIQRRQYAMSLVQQLEEQMQIIKDNPITGVDIQNTDMLTITGSLPAHDIF
jgi:HPt (histidine-containing phosphotransfer) domain-containing protein